MEEKQQEQQQSEGSVPEKKPRRASYKAAVTVRSMAPSPSKESRHVNIDISDRAKSIARCASSLAGNNNNNNNNNGNNINKSVGESILAGETPSPPPSSSPAKLLTTIINEVVSGVSTHSISPPSIDTTTTETTEQQWQCTCCKRFNSATIEVCTVCKMKRGYVSRKGSLTVSDEITSVTITTLGNSRSTVSPSAKTTRRESLRRRVSSCAGALYASDTIDYAEERSAESTTKIKFKPPPPPPKNLSVPSPPSRLPPKSILWAKNGEEKYDDNMILFEKSYDAAEDHIRRRSGGGALARRNRPPPPKVKSSQEMERLKEEKRVRDERFVAMEKKRNNAKPPPLVVPSLPPPPLEETVKITDSQINKFRRVKHWSLSKQAKRDLEHVGLPGRKDYVTPSSSLAENQARRASDMVRGSPTEFERKKRSTTEGGRRGSFKGISDILGTMDDDSD